MSLHITYGIRNVVNVKTILVKIVQIFQRHIIKNVLKNNSMRSYKKTDTSNLTNACFRYNISENDSCFYTYYNELKQQFKLYVETQYAKANTLCRSGGITYIFTDHFDLKPFR